MRLALLLTLLGCAAPLATPAPPLPPVANRGNEAFLQAVDSLLYGSAAFGAVQAGQLSPLTHGIAFCDGAAIPLPGGLSVADGHQYRAAVEVSARLYLC